MDNLITVNCPCCNNKIIINKVTGEMSSDFSFEQISQFEMLNYEFGEKEVVCE